MGSEAIIRTSRKPHGLHSNVRRSEPSGPLETSVVIMLLEHCGQQEPALVSSSGSGFVMTSPRLEHREENWLHP
jgi:hypothetical protein